MILLSNNYRFTLEKGSKKHDCPDCEKRRFVRYVDTTTGNYLPFEYGRCDREIKCGYNLNPYTSDYAKMIWQKENGFEGKTWKPVPMPKIKKRSLPIDNPVFMPYTCLKETLRGYEQNCFIQNLLHNVSYSFNPEVIQKVIELYYLGTKVGGYMGGSITFPFIDKQRRIRTIQVKSFDESNHTIKTSFLHKILEKQLQNKRQEIPRWLDSYSKQDRKVSCLFGEHLLSKYSNNPIALVEAPKTAIYANLYFGFPDDPNNFLWLAVYNLSSLTVDKCKVLQGRDVYLFPDLSANGRAYQIWSDKAQKLSSKIKGTIFKVSDFLEDNASSEERSKGMDLADYLIKQDWRLFMNDSVPSEKSE